MDGRKNFRVEDGLISESLQGTPHVSISGHQFPVNKENSRRLESTVKHSIPRVFAQLLIVPVAEHGLFGVEFQAQYVDSQGVRTSPGLLSHAFAANTTSAASPIPNVLLPQKPRRPYSYMLATSPAIDTQTLVPSIGPSADAAGLQQCSQDQADGDGEDEEDGEFRIEKGPIAGAIHGIPQVLVSGYDIGVSMKVYPKFYKNVGQCATGETRIRAESYGFGTWYILFPPDKIGEVHAGQCAATMNTVRGAPFGDVEVRFLGALGQRIFEYSLLEGASASPQPAVFLVAHPASPYVAQLSPAPAPALRSTASVVRDYFVTAKSDSNTALAPAPDATKSSPALVPVATTDNKSLLNSGMNAPAPTTSHMGIMAIKSKPLAIWSLRNHLTGITVRKTTTAEDVTSNFSFPNTGDPTAPASPTGSGLLLLPIVKTEGADLIGLAPSIIPVTSSTNTSSKTALPPTASPAAVNSSDGVVSSDLSGLLPFGTGNFNAVPTAASAIAPGIIGNKGFLHAEQNIFGDSNDHPKEDEKMGDEKSQGNVSSSDAAVTFVEKEEHHDALAQQIPTEQKTNPKLAVPPGSSVHPNEAQEMTEDYDEESTTSDAQMSGTATPVEGEEDNNHQPEESTDRLENEVTPLDARFPKNIEKLVADYHQSQRFDSEELRSKYRFIPLGESGMIDKLLPKLLVQCVLSFSLGWRTVTHVTDIDLPFQDLASVVATLSILGLQILTIRRASELGRCASFQSPSYEILLHTGIMKKFVDKSAYDNTNDAFGLKRKAQVDELRDLLTYERGVVDASNAKDFNRVIHIIVNQYLGLLRNQNSRRDNIYANHQTGIERIEREVQSNNVENGQFHEEQLATDERGAQLEGMGSGVATREDEDEIFVGHPDAHQSGKFAPIVKPGGSKRKLSIHADDTGGKKRKLAGGEAEPSVAPASLSIFQKAASSVVGFPGVALRRIRAVKRSRFFPTTSTPLLVPAAEDKNITSLAYGSLLNSTATIPYLAEAIADARVTTFNPHKP